MILIVSLSKSLVSETKNDDRFTVGQFIIDGFKLLIGQIATAIVVV